jgi:GT2 family glycosyltransferase
MPRPAIELLNPACAIKPAWAVFDRAWYLSRYADARAVCAGKAADAAIIYYLRVGARLGHSPSALFDEAFYLRRNPDIAELVRAGNYVSGFDHYCQHGWRGVSPHWLFDDELYGNLYEDMTLENLDEHRCYGRYDHYLKSGQRERRMGQFLFDGHFYAAQFGDAAEVEAAGPYVHFLNRLASGEDELAPSIYFDPAWYVEQHPGAKAEIARGKYSSAIDHYLNNEAPENFDPVPQFSEKFYRRRYPDIAAAIEQGMYRSAYQQFVQYGAFELRQPSAAIDLAFYRDLHERVRNDLNSGAVRDAFAHLRAVGLREGLAYAPPDARPVVEEAATRELFVARARQNLVALARGRVDFSFSGAPAVSVVMVVFNKFELTMLSLCSLRQNFAGAVELIVVDNGSTDATRDLAQYVRGAKILRMADNVGFLLGCNAGLAHVTAGAVLFLNNDVELGFGAVAAGVARLAGDPTVGAVGGKIVRTNGVLQEAGSIVWNEATTAGYMRGESPLAAEANFVRDVDYCSAVFLMCRAEVVRELGGFDEGFAPAYFEDVDLCVRMIQCGLRVVYDPAILVTHLEFGSAVTTEASMALMRRGRRIFKKKHAGFLGTRWAPGERNVVQARTRSSRKTILFVEDTVPLRKLGSGFVRSNDVVRAIVAAGYDVHVFPVNGARQYDVMSLLGDFPDTVEILYDRDFVGLPAFLAERADVYDAVWIARTHNVRRVMPFLRAAGIVAPVIVDTEAVVACREVLQSGAEFDFQMALAAEFSGVEAAQAVLAVSAHEVDILRRAGVANVEMLGTAREPAAVGGGFEGRSGLLFVGAMHRGDAPNLAALRWYVSDVLPALRQLMTDVPVLDVVGYVAADVDVGFLKDAPGVRWWGAVADVSPFYAQARVFVAPTRVAAGTPYKIYEAAGVGVPAVVTDLLVAQLGWGDEVLSAPVGDAGAFAAQVARLYSDAALWARVREAAWARLRAENSVAGFQAVVARVLGRVVS